MIDKWPEKDCQTFQTLYCTYVKYRNMSLSCSTLTVSFLTLLVISLVTFSNSPKCWLNCGATAAATFFIIFICYYSYRIQQLKLNILANIAKCKSTQRKGFWLKFSKNAITDNVYWNMIKIFLKQELMHWINENGYGTFSNTFLWLQILWKIITKL